MNNISLEDIEFIKILANSDATVLEKGMNMATKNRLNWQIGAILRSYYKEHTLGTKTGWIKKFEKYGISEDEGKAAIACARRLGVEIY